MGSWKNSEHGFLPQEGVLQHKDILNFEMHKARINNKKFAPTFISSITFSLLVSFGFMFSTFKGTSKKGNFLKGKKKKIFSLEIFFFTI